MDKVDALAETFADDGFCLFEGIMEDQDISDWKAHALSSFEEVSHLIAESGSNFGIGIKNGFKEIVQRHQARFEMPYGANHKKFDVVLENQPLMALVKKVLQSDDVIVANRSFVISLPGAEAQGWHSDGPHVSVNEYLPCHVLNVFVPLVDVDDTNGPTEFRPGSQRYTNNLAKGMLLALAKKRNKPNQAPHVKAGSVLLVSSTAIHNINKWY